MKNLNIMLAVMSVGLVTVPVQAIDFDQVKSMGLDVANRVAPVLDTVYKKIVAGDLDGLETYLNNNIGQVDLAGAVEFVRNNVDEFKALLNDALSKIPVSQAPQQYRAMAQNAVNEIRSSLGYLNYLKTNLSTIEPYAKIGPKEISMLIKGLKAVRAESIKDYNLLKADLANYYNQTLMPLVAAVNKASKLPPLNLDTVKTGIDIVIKTIKGQELDLETELPLVIAAINSLKQLRQVIPLIPQTVRGTTDLALIINNKLKVAETAVRGFNMLPNSVKNALMQAGSYAAQLESTYKMANDKIHEVLKSVQQM